MPNFIDISGQRFSKLLVISLSEFKGNGKKPAIHWNCICDCGETCITTSLSIRNGTAKSCGCGSKDTLFKKTHGKIKSKEYSTWASMKNRALGTENRHAQYRIKGICERWVNSFEDFLEDMGKAPGKHYSIDRIDNNKGYYKENCRWATTKQQNRNYSQNRIISFNGESMTVTDWSEKLGIKRYLIYGRLNRGWSIGGALTNNKFYTLLK